MIHQNSAPPPSQSFSFSCMNTFTTSVFLVSASGNERTDDDCIVISDEKEG